MAYVDGIKVCPNCGSKGPFNKESTRKDGLSVYCQICHSSRNKLHHQKYRQMVLDLLGGKCIRCGFSDSRALQVDHINGGGRRERLFDKIDKPYKMYNMVLKDTNKEKYQLLCANCNVIKRIENGEN